MALMVLVIMMLSLSMIPIMTIIGADEDVDFEVVVRGVDDDSADGNGANFEVESGEGT